MRATFPQLHRLLKKNVAKHISNLSDIKLPSSRVVYETLLLMKKCGLIGEDSKIDKDSILVTRYGSSDSFGSHTTHGAGAYEKWYKNPKIVASFFAFIAKCSPQIKEYLEKLFTCGFKFDGADQAGEGE